MILRSPEPDGTRRTSGSQLRVSCSLFTKQHNVVLTSVSRATMDTAMPLQVSNVSSAKFLGPALELPLELPLMTCTIL